MSVRGGATSEEVAAVVAVLSVPTEVAADTYERWRAGRLAALRRTGEDLGQNGVGAEEGHWLTCR